MKNLLRPAALAIGFFLSAQAVQAGDNIDAKLQSQMQQIESQQQRADKVNQSIEFIFQQIQQCAGEYGQKYGLAAADFSILYLDRAINNENVRDIACLGQFGLDAAKRQKAASICAACIEKHNPCAIYQSSGAGSLRSDGSSPWFDCLVNYQPPKAAAAAKPAPALH